MTILKFVFIFCWFITNPCVPHQAAAKQADMDQSTLFLTLIKVKIQQMTPGGIIVMEDDVMRITLNNPLDKINQIQVSTIHGYMVLNKPGCNLNYCEENIASLASGPYYVTVITKLDMFTNYVTNTP